MSLTVLHRKMELLRRGILQTDVAARLGVSKYLVSKVIQGERARGPKARLVQRHVARLLGSSVADVFGEAPKKKAS